MKKRCDQGCKFYSVSRTVIINGFETTAREDMEWRLCNVPLDMQGSTVNGIYYCMPAGSIGVNKDSNELPCSNHKPWVDCFTAQEEQQSLFELIA